MRSPSIQNVVDAARQACCSLARCANFFNFDESNGWRGWENWLTVDTVRRLNHNSFVRFGLYGKGPSRADILVRATVPITVEVKVSYVDNDELDRWRNAGSYELPPRVSKDLRKLNQFGLGTDRLMLFAVAFERPRRQQQYEELLNQYLDARWHSWKVRWRSCGSILLLAMSRKSKGR